MEKNGLVLGDWMQMKRAADGSWYVENPKTGDTLEVIRPQPKTRDLTVGEIILHHNGMRLK